MMGFNGDRECFVTMKRWMENRNAGKKLPEYFSACGYKKIIIYGAGDIGRLFYEEMKGSDIHIECFIDQNGEGMRTVGQVPVITPGELSPDMDVDIIVVTPVGAYPQICRMLTEHYPRIGTICLKDLVYEM